MERAQRDTESCGGDMERCKHGIKGCKGRPRSVQRGHREVRGNEGAQKGTERHRGGVGNGGTWKATQVVQKSTEGADRA